MKVSVITPIYKGEKYIDRLIAMIYSNYIWLVSDRYKNISVEYILINDSPNKIINMNRHIDRFNKVYCNAKGDILTKNQDVYETHDDCEKYCIGDFSIVFVNNEVNCGIHKSRVNGLNRATGDYVMFLDQDDLITKNALLKLLNKAIETDVDVITANGYRKWSQKKYTRIYKRHMAQRLVCKENIYIYGTDMIFSPGQCIIKRTSIPDEWKADILKDNGCDDCYLWLLMFDKGRKFATIRNGVYCHIENDDNYSNSYNAMEKSFFSMCDMLEANKHYSIKKVHTLKRRYMLKSYFKNEKNILKKLVKIIKNFDIIIITVMYKVSGYH